MVIPYLQFVNLFESVIDFVEEICQTPKMHIFQILISQLTTLKIQQTYELLT